MLGPRIGKYLPDGRVQPDSRAQHDVGHARRAVLWLGWFGFNPGSTMAADPAAIAQIAVTTNMAAAAGCLSDDRGRLARCSASRT